MGGPDEPIVVFDIGNVLIQWEPRLLYRRMLADEAAIDAFFAEAQIEAWNRELDRRGTFAEAVAERVAAHPRWEREIRAFDERWHEMVPGAIAANVAVLTALKAAGRKIYAITNFSREKFALAQERFPFLRQFDGVVVSAREGLLKPDPAIYRLFLDRHALRAGECLFLDDTLPNVEAAREVGMGAVHVTPGLDLAAALRQAGVACL